MNRMEEKTQDFSELPSVVWRIILSMLSQEDQVNLLTTSSRMLAHGQLRSLWETVKIKFSPLTDLRETGEQSPLTDPLDLEKQPVSSNITMPAYQRRMIQFYGHMFRKITISFKCPYSPMCCEDEKALVHLARVWKARSLRLIVFDNDDAIVPVPVAVLLNCVRLRKLELVIWPLNCIDDTYREDGLFDLQKDAAHAWNMLFQCLDRSKMQNCLQTLRLTLSSECPEKAYCILRHCSINVALLFPNVQHLQVPLDQLGIMVAMLTSAGCSQLRTLDVYVVEKPGSSASSTNPADWSRLFAVAPKLKVVCTVLSSHNKGSSLRVLSTHVPVVAVTISRSSPSTFKHHHKVLEAVTGFARSLKLFASFDRWWFYPYRDANDENLVSMVQACYELEHLTYLNPVNSTTVLRLASLDRQWKTFQFVDESIGFESTGFGFDGGDQRETLMGELCQKVSSKLGYQWKPLTDRTCWAAPSLSPPASDLVAKCRITSPSSCHSPLSGCSQKRLCELSADEKLKAKCVKKSGWTCPKVSIEVVGSLTSSHPRIQATFCVNMILCVYLCISWCITLTSFLIHNQLNFNWYVLFAWNPIWDFYSCRSV